ncbi:MAG: M48 family metallopeptidase [Selenomonadaceae bacterium]|nr:M48 family metallopeptidase [Selenomonadaceae bacterium]MBR1858778.1 M48 family metallopeptidase [Selenomonadaceae bacterium]
MNFKKTNKKICAAITAGIMGLTLSVPILPAPTACALGIGDIVGIGGTVYSASQAYKAIDKQIKTFNETEEGREELYQQFRQQNGVNTDPAINARMDSIMQNLTRAVGEIDPSIYDKPYKYFVSNDETLNAACSYGHVMMVNIGAFNYLATDDEIAAIVGHEMGHGQKNHLAKGNKKKLNKLVVAQIGSAAIGGGVIASAVAAVAANNSVAHGDKKLETEADNLSWEYMLHTDYNIGAGAAVMQRLSELYGGKARNKLKAILNPSNHPNTDSRRDNYVKRLYEYSGKHATAADGLVTINKKDFITPAATSNMSSAERSYFVLGNLAKAYHNGQNQYEATVSNGTVYLGNQPIITPVAGDESAQAIADRLNEIK